VQERQEKVVEREPDTGLGFPEQTCRVQRERLADRFRDRGEQGRRCDWGGGSRVRTQSLPARRCYGRHDAIHIHRIAWVKHAGEVSMAE
jgi:hypothetical protein